MKILYPIHATVYDTLPNSDKKEAEREGEKIIYTIIYLQNSDKARFYDLKNRAENDYVLNKAGYPRTVTAVQSLILNYKPKYNSNR